MEDWKFTQKDPSEALAKLHFFSIKKKHAAGEVEARITIKEFASFKSTDLKFIASAGIELNQKTMPFQPCGGSETLMSALTECLRNLRKFDYEGPELPPGSRDGRSLTTVFNIGPETPDPLDFQTATHPASRSSAPKA